MLPTPLVKADRLSRALGGPQIWIKREDLAGLGIGGSKYRILEFTLGNALAEGADVFIAGGMTQSNHPQQVVAAANRLGVPTVVLLGGAEGRAGWQGNMLLTGLSGAEIHVLPTADYDDVRQAQEETAERLRRQGRRPAIVTLTHPVHLRSVFAYANYMLELIEQMELMGISANMLYAASGGPTYSGMLLGALALDAPLKVMGFTPQGSAAAGRCQVAGLIAEASRLLALDLAGVEQAISISDDFLGSGHADTTPEAVAAIKLVASTEGIFLDPVYTGKAMAALIQAVRMGQVGPSDTVVFAHTGGIPALFAFADALIPEPFSVYKRTN
jgi:1-aminocyclopropane-1-carboxylate deaminase/D-cysteine desulfhydrase-like pyridoxal-dependent ACC family enzyme